MNSQKYKTEKLVPIDLPEICASRTELMDVYEKAADKSCIYIHAPAGCGKTVSTLLWLQKSGRKTIWLGLDIYDNALAGFYRFFCSALFSAVPQDERLMDVVKNPAFSVSPVEYTIDVLSQIFFDDCEYALVFDDFHLITNDEIIKSLLYVIKRLPLSVTVLFLSRNDLPGAFSSYKESGKIAFIGTSALAFKSDEIRRYFAGLGWVVTEEEAREAFSLTEGWPIAVSVLAMGGSVYAGEKFKINPIHEYFKAHIWDKLDVELQRFMLKTSIVDKMTAQLCTQITKNQKSQHILDTLLKENMFLSHQEGEYRYHHLFLNFLREEAAKESVMDWQAMFQRAADWYFDSGDHFNALRYYIKCGESRGISTALYHYMKFNNSEMSKVYFINELPEEMLRENPCLYVSCAWCALLFSDAENLYFYLDQLNERLWDIVSENTGFLGIIIFLYTVDPRHTFMEQLVRLRTAVPLVANPTYIPRSLSHNMPYFHRTYRDYSHYALHTEEKFAEFRLVFLPLLGSHYAIIESGIRAGLLYDQNRLKEALTFVERNPATDSGELVFLSKMQIAACLYSMGKADEAAKCRLEIEALLKTERLLYLLPVFYAYEAKLNLLNGDKTAAEEWLTNYFITESDHPELNRIFMHFMTVRAYVVLGDYEEAKILCKKLLELCTGYHRLLDTAEASVLLTIIMRLTDETQEAFNLLQKTLLSMEPYGYIRVFADEGKSLLPMLKKLIRKTDLSKSLVMPGSSYLKEVYLAVYEQSKRYKGIACAAESKPVKLSRQQMLVLELLKKGHKNTEIVELTGLSINTIRYHTKALYQKLDVTNAMDAVLRATELGLIH